MTNITYQADADQQIKPPKPWDVALMERLVLVTVCSFLVFWCVVGCYYVIFSQQVKRGTNWHGTIHRYQLAMQAGDGKEAIFWAKKMYAYEILGKGGPSNDPERRIAEAYALDGQHELAELWSKIAAVEKKE